VDPLNEKIVNIKWYFPELVNPGGYNLYRKTVASNSWLKLNSKTILPGVTKPSASDYASDKELKAYCELADNPSNIKGIAKMALIIKSFTSMPLSKFVGIEFDDVTSEGGKKYIYKVAPLINETETTGHTSEVLATGGYKPSLPPADIKYKIKGNSISFTWKPETSRYYAVNVYRRRANETEFSKANKDPLMITTSNSAEKPMSEYFFTDRNLQKSVRYEYYFEAIDFFGDISTPSIKVGIYLLNTTPPAPPTNISLSGANETVSITWKKGQPVTEIKGFNIYRTTSSDTDFKKINKTIINKVSSTFCDTVSRTGAFAYKISTVDTNGNEGFSNPCLVNVADTRPPAIPLKLKAASDTGIITLRWQANTETDLMGYHIYRAIKNDISCYVKITANPVSQNYFSDKMAVNIKNGSWYKIIAIDQSLNKSGYTEPVLIKLPDVTPPSEPFLKSAEVNTKKNVRLSWFRNTEHDLAGYNVYRKQLLPEKQQDFEKANVKLIPGNITIYTDRYPEAAGLYEYYISAVDSTQNASGPSNHYKAKVPDVENHLFEFASLVGKYSNRHRRVELKWKLKEGEPVLGFVVYKQAVHESGLTSITGLSGENKLTDARVSTGAEYCYQVRAYNLRGDVCYSEKLKVTIK
jgi:fibronectin type 3 domain-containing protein